MEDLVTVSDGLIQKFFEMKADNSLLLLIGGPTLLVILCLTVSFVIVTIRKRLNKDTLDEVDTVDAIPSAEQEIKPTSLNDVEEVKATDRNTWLTKLRTGLTKTRNTFKDQVFGIFVGSKSIDDDLLDKLHGVLYRADLGVKVVDRLINKIRSKLSNTEISDYEVIKDAIKDEAKAILAPSLNQTLNIPQTPPCVILIVGVNGVGKTTTISKLAANFLAKGKSVLLCAADTYRAAAIDQLKVWGDRLGVETIAHAHGTDPAAVAFDAVKAAKARNVDVLIIDTAGRLHNKKELMDELAKISRVIGKDCQGAPHETWLVLDATTGQNAVAQVKTFQDVVNVTGLIVTKLDGTAKGGVLLGVSEQFHLPIKFIGVGEKASDLREFDPNDYVDAIF